MQLEHGGNCIPMSRFGRGLKAIDGYQGLLHPVDRGRI
jgi:hypothetical protein